jgi:diaminopimelate epimerase
MTAGTTVPLHKHQAVGNDFLVLVEGEADVAEPAALAVAACHRSTGVGADGLLLLGRAGEPGVDLTMRLHNADGSVAEMSGNGIRCLVQAARHAGVADGDEIVVHTDAGLRTVRFAGPIDGTTEDLVAAMGPVDIEGEAAEWLLPGVDKAVRADIGNPHLVLLVKDLDGVPDLDHVGADANAKIDGGVNVELIAPDGEGGLRMRVYERGVGETQACGTGASAAAAVARSWGLAGDEVAVRSPGGLSRIVFEDGEAHLGGPVSFVADVDLAWS